MPTPRLPAHPLRPARWVWILGLAACQHDDIVEPVGDGQLIVALSLAEGVTASRVDQGRITLEGPTPRTITVAPGTTETITGLQPGTYTVVLEGLTGGDVELFGEQGGVTVAAGSNTPVSIVLTGFVPTLGALPSTVAAGSPVTIPFSSVPGATAYLVEWDFDPSFASPRAEPATSSTSVTILPTAAGQIHVRVRAVNRLGSRGRASAAGSFAVPPLPTGLLSLAWQHACAIRNGTAWCWGNNASNRLGAGAAGTYEPRPVAVPGGPYTKIAAGLSHTCALDGTGRAWCWGHNGFGQIGNGAQSAPVIDPTPAAAGMRFTELSLGAFHTCGLTQTGEIWCWGGYTTQYPSLGDGSTGFSLVPVRAAAPAGVVFTSLSTGGLTTCAVTTTGDVWCWGSNVAGQLGNGTTTHAAIPTQLPGGRRYRSVAVANVNNFLHPVCAVDVDGAAWCWGRADRDQLGSGSPPDLCTFGSTEYECAMTPRAVQGGLRFDRIEPGLYHTCGELRGGRVACWGDNPFGQLGTGSRTARSSPFEIALPAAIGHVSVGQDFTCRLTSSVLDCWGDSSWGQVGVGASQHVPSPVTLAGSAWTGLTANSCAVTAQGAVSCWGPVINQTRGGADLSSTVTAIGGPPLRDISGRGVFACGLDAPGAAWCWGANSAGLGDGVSTESRTPVPVAGGRTYSAMSVSYSHACAIESGSGHLWCWGTNFRGQLGDGSTNESAVPIRVNTNLSFAEVSLGGEHSCAVTTGARDVHCWGFGFFRQLGFPVTSSPYTVLSPALVPGLSGMTSLTAGDRHTCGLRAGAVVCWGHNSNGQVGTSTISDPGEPPTTVGGVAGVTRVRAAGAATCVIASAGSVQCWGPLATTPPGVSPFNPVPTNEHGIQSAMDVAPGNTTCVLSSAGRVTCWGANGNGAVGAPLPHVTSPTRVNL